MRQVRRERKASAPLGTFAPVHRNCSGGFSTHREIQLKLKTATRKRFSRSAAVPLFYFHLRNDMDVPDGCGRQTPTSRFIHNSSATSAHHLRPHPSAL